MKQLKKTILTLVALLAVTAQAWAQEETLLTTITFGKSPQYSETTSGVVSVTATGVSDYNATYGWLWFDEGSLSVTAEEGYTITKCVFIQNAKMPITDTEAPFVIHSDDDGFFTENVEMNGVTSIEVYGYAGAAAASGPEVAWNKTSKTGSFTMPGGNVELEPEYYPQAVLAENGAPTAINDVPATTDGAIVNAGTVKNIGESTTAQGTVMYYVSTTALDDAALLALDADAWKADVPTAQSFTAAGQAYVYYYVRGNDSDTDEEIFSDGDILSDNVLTVTIAAAPTYAVTFADDIEESDKWTASPNADVTKGTEVTVTYTGAKKILGVKAEKKAAVVSLIVNPVVGQIIGSDGKNYDADALLPTGVTAVAKICYVGSDNGEAAPYNHGLALALSDASNGCYWMTSKTDAGHTYIPTDEDFTSESGLQYNATHNTDAYPAFQAAIANSGTTAPSGCSAWFLASGYQWKQMIGAAGLSNLGLQAYSYYWSSTEGSPTNAWGFDSYAGSWGSSVNKTINRKVRSCLAF